MHSRTHRFLLTAGLAGTLLLGACGSPSSARQNGAPNGGPGTGRRPGMSQAKMQKFADEANAAADKTVLKEEFTAEMTALREKRMAQFPRGGSGQRFPRGDGPRFGSGARARFGSGSRAQGQGPGGANMQERLASATAFWKYTDPNGNEALLALDANGQVIMKWPMPFGRGRPGGQPPPGAPNGQQ